ncbi:L-cystine import ATP-binding protein TcyN [Treponema primitia ZAS-2]|uniref:L-cystine import ATP-binding protein TcyN n=1 Tax=Treponema primitia (strain ATCC BAA-887 / DSM 12427 / ZAS-2) TaxID=545694 RepID=F5YQT8_TREPZ|nr:amino acid ABC transporter ATP-binding protein [Treponema primitia]AEF86415.1 L-cystine import ATP-binding protein TcyN [Treponema primitia ZAS-2]
MSPIQEQVITLKDITKSFGTNQVLKGVSLSVKKGEILSIIGPSGAGKTTLLRTLNWLEKPDTGSITIDGETVNVASVKKTDILRLRSKTSMVFQHYNLFKNKTVLQNVTESLVVVKKLEKAAAEEKALAILRSVGMEDKLKEYPSRLSGGQQQRVGIARALAVDPQVMLFDEPTSALDPEWVAEVLDVIKGIARQGLTMILVSHEMRFVNEVASRVILLDDGLIVEDGSPDQVFNHPTQERTRQFLKKNRDFEVVW